MLVKDIIMEDFINYKNPSMFIICTKCSFKCNKENNCNVCQNSNIIHQPDIELSNEYIISNYLNNNITKSIVFGGLEPFDTFADLLTLIKDIRNVTDDDIVIYSGYTEDELSDYITKLKKFKNIIIKVGRYKPNDQRHYDKILGIYLCSSNQYAIQIS